MTKIKSRMLKRTNTYHPCHQDKAIASSWDNNAGGFVCASFSFGLDTYSSSDDNPIGIVGTTLNVELDFTQDDTRRDWPDWR